MRPLLHRLFFLMPCCLGRYPQLWGAIGPLRQKAGVIVNSGAFEARHDEPYFGDRGHSRAGGSGDLNERLVGRRTGNPLRADVRNFYKVEK